MPLSIGIVGLPNVGKSTLFNALTRAQNAQAANYPFCTIEPNKAIVPVPDPRLDALTSLAKPQKTLPATVEFTDIAGLVKGASKGEGLGNKFLANIRETQAILHVVRCFVDDDVVHVHGKVDPLTDIEVIETELILADAQALENRMDRLRKQARAGKEHQAKLAVAEKLLAHLMEGLPASALEGRQEGAMAELYAELGPITAKPVIYCANVDEAGLEADSAAVEAVRAHAAKTGAPVVKVSARMEEEMAALDDAERAEFLESYGVESSGLDQVIRTGYGVLGLVSYFTVGPKEVRAWTIEQGWKAPKAASVIHTDFERGFIRAEVIAYQDYTAHRTEAACRAAGVLRQEGKEYVVKDGDVMHFLFNV
ncbi:Ribosome-binding ATPase YchF [Fundidesulfovibrio magnetotacticus]|uniref:Ribosome-binding ATPase YchF n=1 Tax=Fundidesulfovibrio magnetotacticus TaxID=2730080 RepID=A0A6V8LUC0_9BACT|nr:redox-regulated ATPase YchF [Fundidesulfovibrio magnetotacticus]GFK93406.1 Ribosome-binding ATPase YchF [Fundidesulfovibrio magnetotacticus]